MEREGEGIRSISLCEALEDYSSHHPESVAELLQWSDRKFQYFFGLHQKKLIIAGLEAQKNAMVAALWANSNWDDNKGTRQNMITKLNEQFEESVHAIEVAGNEPEQSEIDKDNPFFKQMEAGMERLERRVGHLITKEDKDKINYMEGLDQE